MGSLGTGEILFIAFVALIIFGPERLPEIARKAGELLAKARAMTRGVTEAIDAEYGEVTAPIKDLKGEYDAALGEMKNAASSLPDMSIDMPDIGLQAAGSDPRSSGGAGDSDADASPQPGEEAS
ncbi:MAG: twin-arginine translocase TatA/TatE family subunit [Actinomycetota bacterium]